jgi:hypothetical protein
MGRKAGSGEDAEEIVSDDQSPRINRRLTVPAGAESILGSRVASDEPKLEMQINDRDY